jgi:hypothetical protein
MLNQDYAVASPDSLELNKETVQDLDVDPKTQENVKGGWIRPPITWSCPQPSQFCGQTAGNG